VRAAVIGATGYAGAELSRILASHPEIESLALSSVSFKGERIESVYPGLLGRVSAPLVGAEEAMDGAGVVFSALPHGLAEESAIACAGRGVPFIDLSADFRFGADAATLEAWYGVRCKRPDLHERAVYGLTEMSRERLRGLAASGKPAIVANPGCYPTGAALAAFPALARGMAAPGAAIIVDAASGASGGGREPARAFHYPECSDSVSPYKAGGAHRHSPEIAMAFAAMAAQGAAPGAAPRAVFTPHLAPMNRGILSTVYIPLAPEWAAPPASGPPRPPSAEALEAEAGIRAAYAEFYGGEPFARVLPAGLCAATNRVRGSNFCDVSLHLDASGSTLIAASAIDNMVKGAAGQAVQNMNALFGFSESAGLGMIPLLF